MPTPIQSYREIPLTQGQVAIVDAADYGWLNQWRWQARWNPHTKSFYASRHNQNDPKRRLIAMHRLILGLASNDPRKGDHIESGKTLDNRRSNLRIANNSENGRNARLKITNTSGYKGVHYRKDLGQWAARICIHRKRIHLGHFSTPQEAAIAYRKAAMALHKEFARFA